MAESSTPILSANCRSISNAVNNNMEVCPIPLPPRSYSTPTHHHQQQSTSSRLNPSTSPASSHDVQRMQHTRKLQVE